MRLLLINIFSNVLVRLTPIAASFVILPVVLRVLGKEAFGVWAFIESCSLIILAFDMGFGMANEKEVASRRVEGSQRSLNNFIFSLGAVQSVIGILMASVFVVFVHYAVGISRFSETFKTGFSDLYILLALYVLVSYLVNNLFGIMRGLKKHYLIFIINLVYVSSRVLLIVLFLPRVDNLEGFIAINFYSLILEAGILLAVIVCSLRIKFSELKLVKIPLNFLKLSRGIFILQLLAVVLFSSGKILLGLCVSGISVAYFEIGTRVFNLFRNILDSIAQVFLPFVSEKYSLKEFDDIRKIFLKGTSYLFCIWSLMAFPVIMAGKDFIRLWLGEEFVRVAPLIYIFVISAGFTALTRISMKIFISSGELKEYVRIRAIATFIYIILSISLVVKFGIFAPAAAMLIYSILSDIYLLRYSFKYFNIAPSNFITGSISKVLSFNIGYLLIFYGFFNSRAPLDSYAKILYSTGIYIILSLVFFFSVVIDKSDRRYLYSKLFSLENGGFFLKRTVLPPLKKGDRGGFKSSRFRENYLL